MLLRHFCRISLIRLSIITAIYFASYANSFPLPYLRIQILLMISKISLSLCRNHGIMTMNNLHEQWRKDTEVMVGCWNVLSPTHFPKLDRVNKHEHFKNPFRKWAINARHNFRSYVGLCNDFLFLIPPTSFSATQAF